MATYTPNLNLKKPSTGEYYDVVAEYIASMDILDMHIGRLKDSFVDIRSYGAKGDGITDDTQAFKDALSSGNIIYANNGRFIINDSIDILSTTLQGNGTIVKNNSSLRNFITMKGNGPSLKGLTIETTGGTVNGSNAIYLDEGATNVVITGNHFIDLADTYCAITASNPDTGTLYTTNVKGVLIHENIFEGFARQLYLASVEHLTVSANTFKDSRYDAIRTRKNILGMIITENRFLNIGDPLSNDVQTRDFIDTKWSGRDVIITNNYMDTSKYVGIDIKGIGEDGETDLETVSGKIIISGNIIKNVQREAISISGALTRYSGQFIVSDNIIKECALVDENLYVVVLEGIDQSQIVNNSFVSNNGGGVYVKENGTKAFGYAIVTSNHFQNNRGPDFRFREAKGCILSSNIFAAHDALLKSYGKNAQKIVIDDIRPARKSLSIQNNIFDGDECVLYCANGGDLTLKYLSSFNDNSILGNCYLQRNGIHTNNSAVYSSDFGATSVRESMLIENYNLGDLVVRQNAENTLPALTIVGLAPGGTAVAGTVTTELYSPIITGSTDFGFGSLVVGDIITIGGGVLGVYKIVAKDTANRKITLNKEPERAITGAVVVKKTKAFVNVNGA